MKALEYSNLHHINIIPQQDFEELVDEVFGVIADNLCKSLGPLGSSATIFNGGLVEATKDGYTILNRYSFNNLFKKMVYNLIKSPCQRLNNTVGDGTTTAIALTNAIYKNYREQEARMETLYRLPRTLTKAWDEVTAELITKIKDSAVQIDPTDYETIYSIAYVVSNGNEEVSNAVAEVYSGVKYPAIKMKDSPTNKSYIKQVNGFEFPTNAIDPCYVKNQDLTSTETDVNTLIVDFCVDTDTFNGLIIPLNDVARAMGKKLIVVASSYDKYMCETLLGQYVNYEKQKYGKLNLILTQYAIGKLAKNQKEDLAVVLRSKVVTEELAQSIIDFIGKHGPDTTYENILEDDQSPVYRTIGQAKSVLLSCKNGSIFDVEDLSNDTRYNETLKMAYAELDDIKAHTNFEAQSFASKVYDAQARILQLEMKNFIYYIGADSELQKQILEGLIEDVIKCLRSATKNGVVPGCQIAVIIAAKELLESNTGSSQYDQLKKAITTIILNGCLEVYQEVLVGPNGTGIIKTLPRWEYTQPTEEGLNALKNEAGDKMTNIIKESIERKEVWDLEKQDFNSKIITSVETDTMVLTASAELIKILISGNQMIFVDSAINESHQDTIEAYV